MLSVKVEREIKQENRVIGPFTLRQTICLIIALAAVATFVYVVKPDLETGMGIGLCLGAIAWFFGFYKKNGIYIEYFIIKRIKILCFKNTKRGYRTKNRYIGMLNAYYEERRQADLLNKKKARQIRKAERRRKKKKERMKAYL